MKTFTVWLEKTYTNHTGGTKTAVGTIRQVATSQLAAEKIVQSRINAGLKPLQTIDPAIRWVKNGDFYLLSRQGYDYIDFSFQVTPSENK